MTNFNTDVKNEVRQSMIQDILNSFSIEKNNSGVCGKNWHSKPSGEVIESINPSTGETIASVTCGGIDDYEKIMEDAHNCFLKWRLMPAPQRGEILRQMGDNLRKHRDNLGKLVALEMGKIKAEGIGEVQEMIDITDFSVGLSRQLYGLTMHSERPFHRMYEQWHPLGIIGIISAFNFPVAVWSWNAMIAAACGNAMIWKPSEKTPLCAIAVQKIAQEVLEKHDLQGLMGLITATANPVGEHMIADKRLPLISATGSTRMGKRVGEVVHSRLGKTILELGGNNALIVMDDARLDLAVRGIVFGAVGTAGQRCTTTRRLLVQENIAPILIDQITKAYKQVSIGDPLDDKTLMGPLIDDQAVQSMKQAIEKAVKEGGKVLYGGNVKVDGQSGYFVEPTIIEAHKNMDIIKEETFAPILYVIKFSNLEEAIQIQNNVPQGLSSALFTESMRSAETFLSHMGSDCGIANINIGTSGAEIGGAFGGEKETGGGREAGSDSWKAYMRRQTNTINWGDDLPLAQGIQFG